MKKDPNKIHIAKRFAHLYPDRVSAFKDGEGNIERGYYIYNESGPNFMVTDFESSDIIYTGMMIEDMMHRGRIAGKHKVRVFCNKVNLKPLDFILSNNVWERLISTNKNLTF